MNARSFYTTAVATEHYLGIRWPREVWSSVLQQAIKDAVEGPPAFEYLGEWTPEDGRRFRLAIMNAAQNWIDDDENEPRRFVWVCEQLGMDPAAIRKEVERRQAG